MENAKGVELTNDTLTNIRLMIPLLNEESRKAFSYLMYGCLIGVQMGGTANKDNSQK